MNDYFKSLQIDSSALTAEEIQMINDWDQKHKHEKEVPLCVLLKPKKNLMPFMQRINLY